MPRFVLLLAGPVRLLRDDGVEVTPRPAKARGLLAILGTESEHRARRASLIDKLWSDRGPDQGATSLRQVLRQVRVAAGKSLICNGNGWIGLNPEVVSIRIDPGRDDDPPEFASDLDIPDPEFEHWIRDRRTRFAEEWSVRKTAAPRAPTHVVAGNRPCVVVGTCRAADRDLALCGETVLSDAAARIAQLSHAEIVEQNGSEPPEGSLSLSCRITGAGSLILLQPSLRTHPEGEIIWTQTLRTNGKDLPRTLTEAVDALTVAAVAEVTSADERAAARPSRPRGVPLHDVFSYEAARLYRADHDLAERSLQGSASAVLALRAFVRHTLLLERLADDPAAIVDEASDLVRRARERSPGDPFVLSMASLVAGFRKEYAWALELADRAKKGAPDHPFTRHALSVAWSFAGEARKAHEEALAAAASRMTILAPSYFFARTAYTAIGIGDLQRAREQALMAVHAAPDFRAGHRVVAALEYAAGNPAGAETSLKALRRLEPDFSLDLMASESYPVVSLRKANLLEVTKSGLL